MPTLNRFFSLHVIALPFLLALLILLHLVALRQVGSNNPDGIEIKENLGPDGKPLDGIPFHPYYTLKDIVGVGVFLTLFAIVVFFVPTFGGLFLETPNFEPANPMSTPEHIAPVWYFTPYYAILRAIPDQQLGALLHGAVGAGVPVPAVARPREEQVDPLPRLAVEAAARHVLRRVPDAHVARAASRPNPLYVLLARICTALYFAFFILLPFVSEGRRQWPGSRSSDLPCALTSFASSARSRCCSALGAASAERRRARAGWQRAGRTTRVANLPSLQRGARNFMTYCSGCHSLKYMRYSRVARDLKISDERCDSSWCARATSPPTTSRRRCPQPTRRTGSASRRRTCRWWRVRAAPDWIFNFLTTFYADPASRQTGVNNLQLPGTAMPHVLSTLQGVQKRGLEGRRDQGRGRQAVTTRASSRSSSPGAPGSMTPEQYDEFVRDTVNFLDYVGEPAQVERAGPRHLGGAVPADVHGHRLAC